MATGRIHIISPEPEQARSLARILTDHGHEVHILSTVEAALALDDEQPDMVLLDLCIGGDDGARFLRGLKDRFHAANLPVLVLTEGGETAIRESGIEISEQNIIRRPTDAKELADKVKILLEVMRLRQSLASRNQELERLNREMAHLMEIKNRFLSLATHDIRTPVTTMKLVGDVLDKQLAPNHGRGIKRLLDILGRNLLKIEAKIEELLLISRMDLADITVELRQIDLNGVVQDAIAGFFPGAISRGIDIDAQFAELPKVIADPRRIAQLTSELISCSLERLDAGQYMIVETSRRNGNVVIGVCDNGPVMLDGQAEALLRGLENQDPVLQTRANLFYAHQIARGHGGRIDITSSLEGGTVFAALLPLAKEEKA